MKGTKQKASAAPSKTTAKTTTNPSSSGQRNTGTASKYFINKIE